MKQGCGKGQGRLRRLPGVVQDRALASPLLWAPWVVLKPLTLLLWVLPSHTRVLWINPSVQPRLAAPEGPCAPGQLDDPLSPLAIWHMEGQITHTGTYIRPVGGKPSHSTQFSCILDKEASR